MPYIVITSAALLFGGLWLARAHVRMQDDIQQSVTRANATNAAARQMRMQLARTGPGYPAAASTSRPVYGSVSVPASASSMNGVAIHQCAYGSVSSYQRTPCQSPWVEVQSLRESSRRERIEDDRWVRAQAEARLRAEEQRFAAMTGQGSYYAQPSSTDPRQMDRMRCAQAKADRDSAYRVMGNDRSFEVTRYWDDLVYQACKNT